MRGSDTSRYSLTPDLLDVWTDPDTAMEIVGTSLGVFRYQNSTTANTLATDASLRNTLSNVLLALVDGGALEKRPCGGGRDAFRWRRDSNEADAAAAPLPQPPSQLAEAQAKVAPLAAAPVERPTAAGRASRGCS